MRNSYHYYYFFVVCPESGIHNIDSHSVSSVESFMIVLRQLYIHVGAYNKNIGPKNMCMPLILTIKGYVSGFGTLLRA